MKIILLVLLTSFFTACSTDEQDNSINKSKSTSTSKIMTINIAPEKVDCIGVSPMKCLIVDGSLFYDTIQGFHFESGYKYRLQIKKVPAFINVPVPADASLNKYILLKILSKEKV